MKKIATLLSCLMILSFGLRAGNNDKQPFHFPPQVTSADYQPGVIIFKVKPEYRSSCGISAISVSSLSERIASLQTQSVEKLFPYTKAPDHETNSIGQKLADLSLIYILRYSGSTSTEDAVNLILEDESVVYAEPAYFIHVLYTPNDTGCASQYQLKSVHAYQGWDIDKGDSNVVIGITDTGSDIDHPDLINKIKLNLADPVNGVDDDGDGYIDNYQGWDFGGVVYTAPVQDNDPNINNNSAATTHGSIVTGCAVAEPDNGIYGAGTGFNCKYLPVKIADDAGNITIQAAYAAITYAADHGCKIINCSWGGTAYASVGGQMGQDVVDYATINKNCIVVGGAGNNNFNTYNFWPASYQRVLSVGGTDSTDAKWSSGAGAGSNWGPYVDISAPSYLVASTIYDNSWTTQAIGTSFATPIVSGCIGVVQSHFPSLTPMQCGERLRVTADNIDNLPANASYKQNLGKGRANLFRALTEPAKSVRIEDIQLKDIFGKIYKVNDTVPALDTFLVTGNIVNYLDPVTDVNITIARKTAAGNVLVATTDTIHSMTTMSNTTNTSSPFKIITNTAALNSKALFTFTFTDAGGYSDYQSFVIYVGTALSVGIEKPPAASFTLDQNYPNPFTHYTSVHFTLEHSADVSLDVYDVTGRKVMTLSDGNLSQGQHSYFIDGDKLKSGIYYFTLKTDGAVETMKMVKL